MLYKAESNENQKRIQFLLARQMAIKVRTTAARIDNAAMSPGMWFIPKSIKNKKVHHYQFFEFTGLPKASNLPIRVISSPVTPRQYELSGNILYVPVTGDAV